MSHTVITITLNPAIDQTITVPGFAAGRVNRVTTSESHAGGKGINVATVLAGLHTSTAVTGFLGQGNAAIFERFFADNDIHDAFIRLPGETRIGIKIINSQSGETTDINFPGLTPGELQLQQLHDFLNEAVEPGVWVVMGGSVPAGVSADIYASLIAAVHARGGSVVLDTSGQPLHYALQLRPAIAKPNSAELAELYGSRIDTPQQAVQAARTCLLAAGVKLAVVSMGSDGAVFVDCDHAVVARPPKVEVKSTVGAGDSMVAGLVYWQLHQLPFTEGARVAVALGTYAVTRIGAGLDHPDAYAPYLSQVILEPIDA